MHFIALATSGLDCILSQRVQLFLLLLLGLQLLFLLGEPGELVMHGSSLFGLQVQRLGLLALEEFPEVFLLSLVKDSEDTGDGFADDSYLGELGRVTCLHLASHLSPWLPPVTLATQS